MGKNQEDERMSVKRFAIVFLSVSVLIGAVYTTGCHHRPSHTPSNEMRLFLSVEPISLDPRVGGDARSQVIIRELFEGLTRFGRSGEPELAIAESVDISEDRTTYTFHLRPSKWSNGADLTAMDFEWAWKSVIRSPLITKYAYAFFVIKNAQKASKNECSIDDVGITSLDEHTLQVTLAHPAPYFLQWTANPVYSPIFGPIAKNSTEWASEVFPKYVSNGPFVVKSHQLGSSLVLEKNPYYWNPDSAKSDRLRFSIIQDDITAYNMFRRGELDWYGFPCTPKIPTEIISVLESEGSLHTVQSGLTLRIDCCVTKPHVASPKIRKAIAEAINRKEITSHLFIGGDTPAHSIIPSCLSLLQSPPFEDGNVEHAKQLFAEGLAELGMTKEEYPPLVFTTDPRLKSLAEVVSQQVHAALGITVQTEVVEIKTLFQKVASNQVEMAILGWVLWIQDPGDNLEAFKYKDNRLVGTDWENTQYIQLLDAANSAKDVEARLQFLTDAEMLFMKEIPAIPLINMVDKYTKAPDVEGECFSNIGIPELKWLERK